MSELIIIIISIIVSLLAYHCSNINFETLYTYISIALELLRAYYSLKAQKNSVIYRHIKSQFSTFIPLLLNHFPDV